MPAMQCLPLSDLFFRERTIMENQIRNSNIEALNKFEYSKFKTFLRVYVENSLNLMRAWCRDIPEQTVVRRGSSVFCRKAKVPKPNASECSRRSGMSVFAGDVPTPCSSLLSKVRDTSFLFRVENFEMMMNGGHN